MSSEAAPHGPNWSPDEADWAMNPWPGMILRQAEYDATGKVVKETFKRVPLDRALEDALAWAEKTYS